MTYGGGSSGLAVDTSLNVYMSMLAYELLVDPLVPFNMHCWVRSLVKSLLNYAMQFGVDSVHVSYLAICFSDALILHGC